jgi:hypothetical protein
MCKSPRTDRTFLGQLPVSQAPVTPTRWRYTAAVIQAEPGLTLQLNVVRLDDARSAIVKVCPM